MNVGRVAALFACLLQGACLALAVQPQGLAHRLHAPDGARDIPDGSVTAKLRGGSGGGQRLKYAHRTMQELVVDMAGFPLEEHFISTADGYVLGTYRIPSGQRPQHSSRQEDAAAAAAHGPGTIASANSSCARPAVLLLHGLLDSSAAWVLNEPGQSLGFILADAGYDVWLGNSRGNAFSRNHTGLDPAYAPFWDFTWDDMAAYDVPAMVDYVLQQTGCARLAFVGHSQGTTQAFGALAANPGLRDRLSLAVMLAPAVHMRFIQSPALRVLAAMDADTLFTLLGVSEFLPSRRATADIFGQLCRQTPAVCTSIITAIAGFNADNMNMTRLPMMVQYAPSGTSVKNLAHWAQAIRKSRQRQRPLFQQYDYGTVCNTPAGLPQTCNMRVYHSVEPPSYQLGDIRSPPLAVFYGGRDRLADAADVATLLAALPAGAVVYSQVEPSYEHIDFTWGIDASTRVYPAVLDLLRMYP
ncbi:Lysosomal acid lipase/cholesteryl ester hydrolase [Chlorella vulgaris]